MTNGELIEKLQQYDLSLEVVGVPDPGSESEPPVYDIEVYLGSYRRDPYAGDVCSETADDEHSGPLVPAIIIDVDK